MAQTQMMPTLSGNDAQVLNALFDAESSLSKGPQIATSTRSLPGISEQNLEVLQAEEKDIIKLLVTDKPPKEAIGESIRRLGALIQKAPKYAPAYVNRAQARRMSLGDRALTADEREGITLILDDLANAINTASPLGTESPVSSLQAKVLSSAYTHRAHLYYHVAKSGDLSSLPDSMRELGPERLEDLASRDFMMGGKYGNEIAQQMSVRTNPYAKMCGAIVKEALLKEREGLP